jgi:regulator of cell morphogenesis and NO signaling
MLDQSTTTIGDIVAADFRTAAVFERFGIDFCCGGRRSLDDACRSAAVDRDALYRALAEVAAGGTPADDATRWPLPRLIDHIVSTHHGYVRQALPRIAAYLAKLESVHGARHPELTRIRASFEAMGGELQQHMIKEEHVLFPYIADLAERGETCGQMSSPFGTVANPIRMMEREHQDAAEELQTIRDLTDGYTAPADGCTTYSVCMSELAQFEQDLHRHVHLENNVLFPRALDLEQAVCGHN